jgi:hypothetical protein
MMLNPENHTGSPLAQNKNLSVRKIFVSNNMGRSL